MATGQTLPEVSPSPPPVELIDNSQDNVEELLAQIGGVSSSQGNGTTAVDGAGWSPHTPRSGRSGSHGRSWSGGVPSPHRSPRQVYQPQQTPPMGIKGGYEIRGNVVSTSWDNLADALSDDEAVEGVCVCISLSVCIYMYVQLQIVFIKPHRALCNMLHLASNIPSWSDCLTSHYAQ